MSVVETPLCGHCATKSSLRSQNREKTKQDLIGFVLCFYALLLKYFANWTTLGGCVHAFGFFS